MRWLIALLLLALPLGTAPAIGAPELEYVVLYRDGGSQSAARAAVERSGGRIVRENQDVGVATVLSARASFVRDVATEPALRGAARAVPIGHVDPGTTPPKDLDVVPAGVPRQDSMQAFLRRGRGTSGAEPLPDLQWDMGAVRATIDGSLGVQQGDPRVVVGVMDSGIDASHPDIAPTFSRELSRNFTADRPELDGPCEDEPDAACAEPAYVHRNRHRA